MLTHFYRRLEAFANGFSRYRFWKFYLALLCALYCIVTNVPQYSSLLTGKSRGIPIWNRVNRQIDHPFTADSSNDPESHEARLTFRLTAPLIGKVLPTNDFLHRMQGLFVIYNLCGVLFFYLLICFAEAHFGSRLASFLLPWCFAVIYAGKIFFCDTAIFFDGLAYLFLLIAISSRKPGWVFAGLFLAFYTDERAIIGSGFVLLYYVLQQRLGKDHRAAIYAVFAAGVSYVISRLWLQHSTGMSTPVSDLRFAHVAQYTYFSFILLGVFVAFKSYWLLFGAGLFLFKGFWPRAIFIGTLLAVIVAGVSVLDFSRSISYGCMGLLAVLSFLYQTQKNTATLNKLLAVLFLTSFINPIYDVHRHDLNMTRSVIGRYLEMKFTKSPELRDSKAVRYDD